MERNVLLEAARLRLRTRFYANFPSIAKRPTALNPAAVERCKNLDHLEAARQRLHSRFVEKFQVSASLPMTSKVSYRSDQQEPLGSLSSVYLEAARHRTRNRFQKKFRPNFDDFPVSVDMALKDMHSTDWGRQRAIVVTSAEPPFRILQVNKAWEDLCGFTQDQAVGQTFGSLGIQGPFTKHADVLDQHLHRKERVAMHLTNATADGKLFQNYLSVAPLVDSSSKQVTHFIGVLQDDIPTRQVPVAM